MQNEPKTNLILSDFWCAHCGEDRHIIGIRRPLNKHLGSVIFALCDKCYCVLRRYPDRPDQDPYFKRSRKVKAMKNKYARDILQPGQSNFDILYPAHKREKIEKENKKEKELWNKK